MSNSPKTWSFMTGWPTQPPPGRSFMSLSGVILGLLLFAAPLWAQPESERIPWRQLTPADQQYLQRFGERWDQMSRQRQERLLNGAQRWRNMSPEERREAKQRFQRWRELPPEQQQH